MRQVNSLRKFIVKVAVGTSPVILFALACVYYNVFVHPEISGDLGALAKISLGWEYNDRMNEPRFADCKVRHFGEDSVAGRIFTIGDSFSQQGINGYQNFLGHQLDEIISNYPVLSSDRPEDIAIGLLNSGFFDHRPQIEWVIVESVERELTQRLLEVDFSCVHDGPRPHSDVDAPPASGEFLHRMVAQTKDWLLFRLHIARPNVRSVDLTSEMFTLVGKDNQLYFYAEDLNRLSVTDEEQVVMSENLRAMHDAFRSRGIKMLYMIAPDKYEVYQYYAVNNPYPEKILGRQLEALDSLGFVVNPIRRMRQMLDAGCKDLYMAHDTHWSPVAAAEVAEMLRERIVESSPE